MKTFELMMNGFIAVGVGLLLVFTPLVNIIIGWRLAPFLILGGITAVILSIVIEVWEALRITSRYLICAVFKEEKQGRPAFHRVILNARFWQLLGGGHCPVYFNRKTALAV